MIDTMTILSFCSCKSYMYVTCQGCWTPCASLDARRLYWLLLDLLISQTRAFSSTSKIAHSRPVFLRRYSSRSVGVGHLVHRVGLCGMSSRSRDTSLIVCRHGWEHSWYYNNNSSSSTAVHREGCRECNTWQLVMCVCVCESGVTICSPSGTPAGYNSSWVRPFEQAGEVLESGVAGYCG